MTVRTQDMMLGALCGALGLAAAWRAPAYSGATGTYPMVLGGAMAALGLLIALRAALQGRTDKRPLVGNGRHVAISVAAIAAYIALIPLLGFYPASVVAALILPVTLGFRRPLYTILTALVFMVTIWLIFAVLLEKPLPGGFWAP